MPLKTETPVKESTFLFFSQSYDLFELFMPSSRSGYDRDIVLKAKQEFKEDIYLVLGGFHLGNASASQVNEIIKEFDRIGVKYVAPCHCTGEQAISIFRNAFGEDFIQVGVGKVIEIES